MLVLCAFVLSARAGVCPLQQKTQKACVIRLSLGKQLVNLLQLSKQTNTLQFLNEWRRRQTMGFWVVGSNSTIHKNKLLPLSPRRTSGPEAFTLLLRLLVTHFDRVDTGEGYTKLYAFGICNDTPFSDFSREFRVLVSTATGGWRVLSPGTDVVLEVIRMAVNEQFPTLMPMLYPGSKAADPRPYALLDAMWRVFSDLAHNKTPAVNGEKYFSLLVSSTGARPSAPLGPRPADHGRGQGRVPSQSLSWQIGSSHHPTVMPIDDSSDPWLDQPSNS